MAIPTCPTFYKTGVCKDRRCVFAHTVYSCGLCRLVFKNEHESDAHCATKAHKKRAERTVEGGSDMVYCEPCNINVHWNDWKDHSGGIRHTLELNKKGLRPQDVTAQPPRPVKGHIMCDICNEPIPVQHRKTHERGPLHRSRIHFAALQSAANEATRDRNGVSLSHQDGINFGNVEVTNATQGQRIDVAVTVAATANVRRVDVKVIGLSSSAQSFTASASGNKTRSPIYVTLKQTMFGYFKDRLEITFEDVSTRRRFGINRDLTATVIGSSNIHEKLKPDTPYVRKPKVPRRDVESEIEPCDPPALPAGARKMKKLDEYKIPKYLAALFVRKVDEALQEITTSHLPVTLNGATYGHFWKILLWAEEHRAELDLQIYDMEDAVLEKRKQGVLFWLRVPGLAEKRPSVLREDKINVRPKGSEGKWFEGRVDDIQELRVGMRFAGKFSAPSSTQRFSVRFKLNRVPLRRQHAAMSSGMYSADRVLFPKPVHWPGAPDRVVRRHEVTLFNELIAGNQPQVDAIMSILNLPEGAPPFCLFGPPGTGKTVTLVEAALQVVTLFPNYRLLITAPSNSAADLVTQRLSQVLNESDLFRIYARSVRKDQVPESLLPYTRFVGSQFDAPSLETLMKYRVVVCTCVSGYVPYQLDKTGVPRGHFNGIFIDEAGQASEPEVMISVKTLADDRTNVVLAGDPKQLGPVIRSAIARELGLAKSYLERLMAMDMYTANTGNDNGRSVVKLIKNYRSHEAILAFPNDRFYGGELVSCASDEKRNACLNASVLVNKKYPIVFHSISGKNERESTSPSYFNILEAEQVKIYIDKLVADSRVNVRHEDIGVIAPYHAQVVKIKKLLREVGTADDIGKAKKVKVGSVEEFQGQERKVIFVSTVRSSRDLVEFDLRHTLGFVANARRFNVAVTRAQALLVIVGDPEVLGMDPLWRSFLNVVQQNGGWQGPPIPWDPTEPVNEEGGYDAQARDRGAADLIDLANRFRVMDMGEEDDAALERVVVEED